MDAVSIGLTLLSAGLKVVTLVLERTAPGAKPTTAMRKQIERVEARRAEVRKRMGGDNG